MKKVSGLALATAVIATLATGCETGRSNKIHVDAEHISDVTTTGQPDTAFAADPSGQPPVPGSPTAAGTDGKQPYQDADSRLSAGVEEGKAAPPNRLTPEAFQRQ